PPPILIQNVLLAHANGGADEIAHLLGPTLGPEVFLDLNPLLSRLRILDKASQQCLVDTTLFIAEVCRDDGVWIRPEHHVVHLVIRHANAEAVHLMLEQLVFYELLKDELALLIEELWRHRLPGTLLILLYLSIDHLGIFLVGHGVTIDNDDVRATAHPDHIQATGILQYPDDAECKDENPQDDPRVLAHFVHCAHQATSVTSDSLRNRIASAIDDLPERPPGATGKRPVAMEKPGGREGPTGETPQSHFAKVR